MVKWYCQCVGLILLMLNILVCSKKEPTTAPTYSENDVINLLTPANHATEQDLALNLTWDCADTAQVDVYFDTVNPPKNTIATDTSLQSIHVSGLLNKTTYYWQIVAKYTADDSVQSNVYAFSTKNKFSSGLKLTQQLIETDLPCFVNIMFQVTDMNDLGIDYLQTEDFSVFEDDQPVSPTESAMHIRKKDQIPYTLKTVLLLDNSASVGANLQEIKNAAIALVQNIESQQQIAVYKFSDTPVLIQDFTQDVSSLTSAINSISLGYATTDLYGSVIKGVSRWEDIYSTNEVQQGFLIALTDGSDTQGSHTLSAATRARGLKKVYTIGLGSEIDPAVLQELGNAGFYSITDINNLATKFTEIQYDMAQYANSFYWLNYMSPKRGSKTHTLELYIKNNPNPNYISGSFNSASFYSVYSGLYINPTDLQPYGTDTLTVSEYDTTTINAVTYLGNNPPDYQWSSGNKNYITVHPNDNDPSIAQIIALVDSGKTTTLTLNDVSNDLTTTITVIISKDHFFIEDFETGTLSPVWSNTGNIEWSVTDVSSYEGTYSVTCGNSYYNTANLEREIAVPSNTIITISMYTRETDTSGSGHLYINDNSIGSWDNNSSNWSKETITFNNGDNKTLKFRWYYYTYNYGQVYIDNIEVTW